MDGLLRNCATGCRVDEAFTMDDLDDSISADTSGLRCGPVEDRIHHAGMDGLLRNCGTGCRVDEAFTMDDLVDSISVDTSGLRCGCVRAPVLALFPLINCMCNGTGIQRQGWVRCLLVQQRPNKQAQGEHKGVENRRWSGMQEKDAGEDHMRNHWRITEEKEGEKKNH
ncbi:hypothetical protein DPX16_23578 [Anabarilius grahami]|uniref:Uncharacterized protein n=1 Tax=Anabarilius grahami TaxID=495550 RepID=A0A3N0XTT3_ANAGA|nr:hypothetical protein DPX16_23578 [Anabarilius grahami]